MEFEPLSEQDRDEIEERAVRVYEEANLTGDADQLAGEDVPMLIAEIRRLHAELHAEKQDHAFTRHQRDSRVAWLLHLRDLALADDRRALVAAAKDPLAAAAHDHDPTGTNDSWWPQG